ncbi:PREDICTED: hippocampus abundant transcript 1 protein [Papilio polytes]|uniref:hippocampus abundant transcript 1 protein n=1 Tax=Papilio polytes TaxID=76194 RepID=UPI00067643F0|nr:PREDICTED: hippocampus abundant transcript 1 protein [Papilio polytes]
MTPTKTTKTEVEMVIRNRKTVMKEGIMTMSGIGEPSVFHALVVIFLEFFAWGLLTMPIISVLNATFPDHTFLMNGLIMGIKGILSFLSAPLIGALSDVWGRKFFLLVTVFFTCAPIPLMTINTWWFFAMISISGVFAVTFSIVFAYVADVTTEAERSRAYGLVSATFAASMVISPALGAYLMDLYGEALVVAAATAVAVLDVFFIMVAVPESLPEKVRPSGWGPAISWEQADPFAALRKVGAERTVLMLCVAVFLSYLPEAGQYSCIFVYLKLVMGFGVVQVAIFIAIVGVLSIAVQVVLGFLMRSLGAKHTIMVGLLFEMLQLMWYGFGSRTWMMWAAGVLAALGSLTYPAISAYVSVNSRADRQGVVQGMVTGVRGLCNGLGPAMFGVIFYLFHVDLNEEHAVTGLDGKPEEKYVRLVPGPPFVLGALLVICALLVAAFLPEDGTVGSGRRAPADLKFEVERGRRVAGPLSPLMAPESAAL